MNSTTKKIGILGGTFDPIHNGHLAIAAEVLESLGLFEVLFIPTGKPWQKAGRRITDAGHRLKMVTLAIAGQPQYKLSEIEVKRPGSTYTVDTLQQLKKQYDTGTELYFILGWDALLGAPYWKEPGKIIDICRVVAVPRPGINPPNPAALDSLITGLAERLVMLDRPQIDISASDIRRRIAGGLPWEHLVPAAVAEYIKENGLYLKV